LRLSCAFRYSEDRDSHIVLQEMPLGTVQCHPWHPASRCVFLYQKRSYRDHFDPKCYWIVDGSDRLIFGDATTYEIRSYGPDGTLKQRILRDLDTLPVTKSLIDEYRKRPVPPGISHPTHYRSQLPAFRSFFSDDQGRL